jgi:hypothetical protein
MFRLVIAVPLALFLRLNAGPPCLCIGQSVPGHAADMQRSLTKQPYKRMATATQQKAGALNQCPAALAFQAKQARLSQAPNTDLAHAEQAEKKPRQQPEHPPSPRLRQTTPLQTSPLGGARKCCANVARHRQRRNPAPAFPLTTLSLPERKGPGPRALRASYTSICFSGLRYEAADGARPGADPMREKEGEVGQTSSLAA